MFLLVAFAYWVVAVTALWPQPRQHNLGNSTLWWSPNITLYVEDEQICRGRLPSGDHQMVFGSFWCKTPVSKQLDAVKRLFNLLQDDIEQASFVPWKFHAANSKFEPSGEDQKHFSSINVKLIRQSDGDRSPEYYQLSASEDGEIHVKAREILGVRHAFTTLAQLFYRSSVDGFYTSAVPFEISDTPEYAHRGLNLDIARNEISPTDIKRTLSVMRYCKFNKLHLHATDSQSWPLEIPALPELHTKGAYRPNHFCSVQSLREVQEYGQSLGIEVYLEIDMPGHTASIYHSFPELIAGYKADLAKYSAAEPPAGQFRLNSTAVSVFVDTLLADLLPRIAPYSTHFHIGGDELNSNIYALDPTTNSTDKMILRPLLQAFYDRVLERLQEYDLVPVLWQEAVLDWNLTLPANSLVQIWRSDAAVLETILRQGYRALFGAASHWYLDCGYGSFLDPSGKDSIVHSPYADWCHPYKSWRHVFSYDPLASISSDLHHLIDGGEVHLWGELVDGTNLDGKLWSRAAAASEVLWSGPVGQQGLNENATRRLADLRERLVQMGVKADMVTMTWCLQNHGGCVA